MNVHGTEHRLGRDPIRSNGSRSRAWVVNSLNRRLVILRSLVT